MRTTLAISDDVLLAAKAIAREQGKSVGEVVSELARRSLRKRTGRAARNGVPLLAVQKATARVTLETVNALRDETL
ncbi:MAG: CopG family transcriptional regulator [Methylobacteriaceae bacterium]|nr:CopG family transcriptional regulator [Methylobacteriaceae bacterium]